MFHRVKSEVQDADAQNAQEKSKPTKEVEHGRKDELRAAAPEKVEKTSRTLHIIIHTTAST